MNFPILSSLILLPIVGALFLFFTKDKEGNNLTAKYVALFTTVVNFLISITKVKVSVDLSSAKIYTSVFPSSNSKKAMELLYFLLTSQRTYMI